MIVANKMEKIYEVKNQQQRKALNAWAKDDFNGSIIAGTGFGKSRCGVLAIKKLLQPGERALVLVPTTQLQDQFAEEFKKWDADDVLEHTDIICYQSAYKLKAMHYAIVVCDEIHLGISPKYRKFFENNTYDRLLCMTATVPEDDEYRNYLMKLAPIRFHISLDECVELGLVSPYEIVCIPVELNEEDQVAYKKAQNKFLQAKYRIGDFDAFTAAKLILAKKIPGDAGAAKMFFNAISERTKVVQHSTTKIDKAKELVAQHTDDKILVFSGTNRFTDAMADSLSALAYHSAHTKKRRAEVLESFKDGSNRILCSTKALNQGFDVPDASVGIIAGLVSKSLPMIQRVGRLLRLNTPDKIGKIYIVYVHNSQEEKWLKQAVKSLNNVKWLTL
tara:strand:- start:3818 stop:4987 length:1170 start_codon:yes stop_codon:yes gene_type:complete